MQLVAKYMYNLWYNKNIERTIELNKYCSCNSVKYYVPDRDAYGEWIICENCKNWCGWYYNMEYFNREGNKI